MTNAVIVQTMSVSTRTPKDWIIPCFTGCFVSAVDAMLATEPRPASLEKTPLLSPLMMTVPNAPPIKDGALNALTKIMDIALPRLPMLKHIATIAKMIQINAMMGTIFDENLPIFFNPPKMMAAAATAMIAP